MSSKVLIADSEPDVLRLVASNLSRAGFLVSAVSDGEQVVDRVIAEMPSLLVLEVMLSGFCGFEICRLLKSDLRTNRIPIVILTARAFEQDRIRGLELGADDYVTKPFSPRELVLRVQAQLRKSARWRASGDTMEVGEIVVDRKEPAARVAGHMLALTATEFHLLSVLMERTGRVQSRDRLLTDVWGYSNTTESRTVDIYITRLRQKLGPAASHLETVRGFGYRLTENPAR